ncbi:hypothetical protein N0754_18625 [Pseudomonas aeruginosa]|nr:hypothetical protein [Pseudomonas aeruginosa]MCS9764251.1 hypothetical protein [Pseudomonas aeruginosa]MCS9820427.1 hypothetical protein [Pseudomonas aeruginosa]MCT0241008.1 hypothetical protein [Pseudomonas aeruginosa]MCT0528461.1 hypothetical protein [Pseudomonas aeruginosa]
MSDKLVVEPATAALDQTGLEQAATAALAWSWPAAGQFADVLNSQQMGDFLALCTPQAVLDLLARAQAAEEAVAQAERERDLLGQLLGECVAAAGITRPDAELSGPQLLMFGEDLKRDLEKSRYDEIAIPAGWTIMQEGDRIVVQHQLDGAGYAAEQEGPSGIAEAVLFRLASDLISRQTEADEALGQIGALRAADARLRAAQDRVAELTAIAFPKDSLITVRIGTDRQMPCTVRAHVTGRDAGHLRCMPERGKRTRASMRSIHWAYILSVAA